jgi:hypothetical protein
MVLPPLYQRSPGTEIPATGFAVFLKILVKANLHPRARADTVCAFST